MMLTKSRAIESIQSMPDQVTIKEIIEHLQSLDDLETALEAIQHGTTRPHAIVMQEARQWLKDQQWPQL
jgi:hypothetical protein